jgi:hypothetical protein
MKTHAYKSQVTTLSRICCTPFGDHFAALRGFSPLASNFWLPARYNADMNRAQRVVLAIYCLLLAYCCIWIPWRLTCGSAGDTAQYVIYSLLWVAPQECGRVHSVAPHLPMVVLRIAAVTAICVAALALTGIRVSTGSKR